MRSGRIHQQGTVAASRTELDSWMKTLPGPWTVAMEATIFTGWIYDHLLPHAAQVKVAHPVMLRAIAAAKKKNDRIDAGKIADCLPCDFLPECHMVSREIRDRRHRLWFYLDRHLCTKSLFEFLARSEIRPAACGNFNGCTSAWITTGTCLCFPRFKSSEPSQFHAITSRQGI
jgi:hypothetical protein